MTRHPTDAWMAQQLPEAMPFGEAPGFLIRDNDGKYGPTFPCVAETSRSTVLRAAYRAPRQNATCERFLGGARRECLDHILMLGKELLREYVAYFNRDRPHRGQGQRIPDSAPAHAAQAAPAVPVRAIPVVGGLHHAYQRAA